MFSSSGQKSRIVAFRQLFFLFSLSMSAAGPEPHFCKLALPATAIGTVQFPRVSLTN